jgi:hypothetical protein
MLEPQPSVEEGIAEMLNIHMCPGASPQEFMNKPDAGATGYFFGHFKTFINCSFQALAKKHRPSRAVIFMH